MAALFPGAMLVIMAGTRRFAPFEQPGEFNRIVLEILAALTVLGASSGLETSTEWQRRSVLWLRHQFPAFG